MLRIGIIGCGKIATLRHIPEYADNPHVRLTGFYDALPERAEEAAKPFHATVHPSVESLLADPGIDAVSVCAANSAHAPVSIAALKAGKHVLCEKPMATTLEDCESMVVTAEQTGRLLMLGHNQRYAESNRIARELVERGEIGDILSFHACFGHHGPEQWTGQSNPWFFDKQLALFGAVADLGIHKIDVIHYLCGETATEVTAWVETLHKTFPDGSPITVDDNAICVLRLTNGAIGTVQASWTLYGKENNSTRLYGTKGVLRIDDDPEHSLILEKKTGEVFRYKLEGLTTNERQLAGQHTRSGVVDAFVEAIRTGRPSISEGHRVLPAMRVVFGALRSADSRMTVRIGSAPSY